MFSYTSRYPALLFFLPPDILLLTTQCCSSRLGRKTNVVRTQWPKSGHQNGWNTRVVGNLVSIFFLASAPTGQRAIILMEIFKAQLGNISKTASKEAVETELRSFNPVHIAYTGNPSQCNFGRGCGIVGFYTLTDLALAVKTTRNSTSEKVKVTIEVHTCLHCDCPMRFSSGGAPLYKSSNVTGTRKEPKLIARPAAGDFDCGECRTGVKKVNSSVQPRALKQGEVIW